MRARSTEGRRSKGWRPLACLGPVVAKQLRFKQYHAKFSGKPMGPWWC